MNSPTPGDPRTNSPTPSDAYPWKAGVGTDSALYAPGDIYVCSETGMDRFSPDGRHRWHVDTDDEPSMVVSGGSTVYHMRGTGMARETLVARDVATGEKLWTHYTHGHTLAASESAVFVGETSDDLSTGGQPVFAVGADSGRKRWEDTIGSHSHAVLTHDLCLVPHWKGTLTAFDTATGERRWEDSHDGENEFLQVAGDAAYLLTDFTVKAYALPSGEKRWDRSLDPQQGSMATGTRTDTIVTGSREGTLHGLDAETGDTEWALELPGEGQVFSIARGATTVAVVRAGTLYGFDAASGDERWRVTLRRVSSGRPVAVVDGTLVLAALSEDDELHVKTFDAESGHRRWSRAFDGKADYEITSDTLIVLTEAGELYGFKID